MRKKGIAEVLATSVMSLYEGAKTGVRVESELSEVYEAKLRRQQGSVLSPFPFSVVVDVVMDRARDDVLSELLHADD